MPYKISLIIPLKDEERSVSLLLDSVLNQTRKPDEVVITDAGSSDGTIDLVKKYKYTSERKGLPVLRLIEAINAYPGTARNIAIAATRYDVIAMTDGGIVLEKDWLKELESSMESHADADIVYGNYQPNIDSFFKECLALAFIPPPEIVDGTPMKPFFIASALMKKDVWKKVGGFPPFRAAEDRIFMERVKKAGCRIAFAPRANVVWEIPANLRETFRRFSLFSFHDLKAGRFDDWHRPVLAKYLIGMAILVLGVMFSSFWYLLLGLFVFLRAVKLILEKSGSGPRSLLDLRKVLYVTVIMFWIDCAMIWGFLKFITRRK